MTDEVKQLIDVMAMLDRCSETPCCKCEQLEFNGTVACNDETAVYRRAAKLLETFCSELEQVKRERDAAVMDLEACCPCEVCTRSCQYDKVNAYDECADFEWRGVKMDRKEQS